MIFTKYCRTPEPERLNFDCYFSYGSEIFFKSMFRAGEGQFIHRLSTGEWWKRQKSEFRTQKAECKGSPR